MANLLVGNVWRIDTVGRISSTPIGVKRIVLFPSAANDAALFHCAYVGSKSANRIHKSFGRYAATVSGGNTITSTGAFAAANVAAGDIIDITRTSTGNNLGPHIVTTRSNDDAVIVASSLTNESNEEYEWTIYNGFRALGIKAGATDKSPVSIDFSTPQRFPNLFLYTLSASATVDLYLE